MKRFRFSLQNILNVREFKEQQAELELKKAITERDGIVYLLQVCAQKKIRAIQDTQDASLDNYATTNALRALEFFFIRLEAEKEALLNQLAQAELVVEQKRALYTKAHHDAYGIKKLKEKQYRLWHKEFIKADDAMIDDIVTS